MVSLNEFSEEIIHSCRDSEIVKGLQIEDLDNVVLKIRVFLVDDSFIDIFYNEDTEKTAYALIKNNRRIYGADNTGGWHYHPFENPNEHISCEKIKFKDFIETIEEKIKQENVGVD